MRSLIISSISTLLNIIVLELEETSNCNNYHALFCLQNEDHNVFAYCVHDLVYTPPSICGRTWLPTMIVHSAWQKIKPKIGGRITRIPLKIDYKSTHSKYNSGYQNLLLRNPKWEKNVLDLPLRKKLCDRYKNCCIPEWFFCV